MVAEESRSSMISIDPGISAGYAVWSDDGGQLQHCGLVDPLAVVYKHTAARVVYEKPFVYPRSPVDSNTLITLSVTAGMLVAYFGAETGYQLKFYYPRSWKGQIAKTKKLEDYVIFQRIVKRMKKKECDLFAKALTEYTTVKEQLDVVDAVGIGMHDLGRL